MTFFNGFQPENVIKIIIRNMSFQPLIAVSPNDLYARDFPTYIARPELTNLSQVICMTANKERR